MKCVCWVIHSVPAPLFQLEPLVLELLCCCGLGGIRSNDRRLLLCSYLLFQKGERAAVSPPALRVMSSTHVRPVQTVTSVKLSRVGVRLRAGLSCGVKLVYLYRPWLQLAVCVSVDKLLHCKSGGYCTSRKVESPKAVHLGVH